MAGNDVDQVFRAMNRSILEASRALEGTDGIANLGDNEKQRICASLSAACSNLERIRDRVLPDSYTTLSSCLQRLLSILSGPNPDDNDEIAQARLNDPPRQIAYVASRPKTGERF